MCLRSNVRVRSFSIFVYVNLYKLNFCFLVKFETSFEFFIKESLHCFFAYTVVLLQNQIKHYLVNQFYV